MTQNATSYVAFRNFILSKCDSSPSPNRATEYGAENGVHPLSLQKARIRKYREYVAYHLSDALETSPSLEPHVRRALGVPATVPLLPGTYSRLRQLGQLFLPERFNLERARKLLRSVRTPEGREYIYKKFLEWTLPGTHYCESVDFALRHLKGAREVTDLKRIWIMDVVALQAMARIGLNEIARIADVCRTSISRGEARLLMIYVEEGVVREPKDFAWVSFLGRDRYRPTELDPTRERALRASIRLLAPHGVDRARMSEVFYDRLWALHPERLRANLEFLQSAGVGNIAAVFDQVQNRLWTAPAERWKYLLECAHVDVCADSGLFKETLDASTEPSWELTRWLIGMGAGSSAIAACQTMLLGVGKIENRPAPTTELELLAGAPYALNL